MMAWRASPAASRARPLKTWAKPAGSALRRATWFPARGRCVGARPRMVVPLRAMAFRIGGPRSRSCSSNWKAASVRRRSTSVYDPCRGAADRPEQLSPSASLAGPQAASLRPRQPAGASW
jgi:hypothetical protein